MLRLLRRKTGLAPPDLLGARQASEVTELRRQRVELPEEIEQAEEKRRADAPSPIEQQRADQQRRLPSAGDRQALEREDHEQSDDAGSQGAHDQRRRPVAPRAVEGTDHQPEQHAPDAAPERQRDHLRQMERRRRSHHVSRPGRSPGHVKALEQPLVEDQRGEEARHEPLNDLHLDLPHPPAAEVWREPMVAERRTCWREGAPSGKLSALSKSRGTGKASAPNSYLEFA